jgi:Protein of unknown function (DUF1353)
MVVIRILIVVASFLLSKGSLAQSDIMQVPKSPIVKPSGNNRAFILMEPMQYIVGNTSFKITVPAGFVTDYASIPEFLWSFYSPHDQYSRAAIVHDYLYWTQKCTKPQADNLFVIAMKESLVIERTQKNVYDGVHIAGQSSWDRNTDERKKGMPRIVQVAKRDFPDNWTWEQYQAKLFADGYRDPIIVDQGDYCVLGDTQQVPGGQITNKQLPSPKLENVRGRLKSSNLE